MTGSIGSMILGAILSAFILGFVMVIVNLHNRFEDLTEITQKLEKDYYDLENRFYRETRNLRDFRKRVYQAELDIYALQNGGEAPIPVYNKPNDSDEGNE